MLDAFIHYIFAVGSLMEKGDRTRVDVPLALVGKTTPDCSILSEIVNSCCGALAAIHMPNTWCSVSWYSKKGQEIQEDLYVSMIYP